VHAGRVERCLHDAVQPVTNGDLMWIRSAMISEALDIDYENRVVFRRLRTLHLAGPSPTSGRSVSPRFPVQFRKQSGLTNRTLVYTGQRKRVVSKIPSSTESQKHSRRTQSA